MNWSMHRSVCNCRKWTHRPGIVEHSKSGNISLSAVCLTGAHSALAPSDSVGNGASYSSPQLQYSLTPSWPSSLGCLTIALTAPIAAYGQTRRCKHRWQTERKSSGPVPPSRSGGQHPGIITEHLGIPVWRSTRTAARAHDRAAVKRSILVNPPATSPTAVVHFSVLQPKEHQRHGT